LAAAPGVDSLLERRSFTLGGASTIETLANLRAENRIAHAKDRANVILAFLPVVEHLARRQASCGVPERGTRR
jgi:hypothetical protein